MNIFLRPIIALLLFGLLAASAVSAGSFTEIGTLTTPRQLGTQTLLTNGQILIAGGFDGTNDLASAELYDPTNRTFSVTGSLHHARNNHAAVLLPNGKVLVVGGISSQTNILTTSELYNPATHDWTETGPTSEGHSGPTAVLLLTGKVLIVGTSYYGTSFSRTAEIYDPATEVWTNTAMLNEGRSTPLVIRLSNGKVLVAGAGEFSDTSAEIYDSASATWTNTGSMHQAHAFVNTAALLKDGKVLLAGGFSQTNLGASTEIYNPDAGAWAAGKPMNYPRYFHTTTLLADGTVLVAGGDEADDDGEIIVAEVYDPTTESWNSTGSVTYPRTGDAASLLLDGTVLIAGGYFDFNGVQNTAELYHPDIGWTGSTPMANGRSGHSATLLPNGKLLVAGGFDFAPDYVQFIRSDAELFCPETTTWMPTGAMTEPRCGHTATLLTDGRVLVTGGQDKTNTLDSSEIYDPTTGVWTNTGSLNVARYDHTATLLPNGKVLVAGGTPDLYTPFATAELYDPATGKWTFTGEMNVSRFSHSANLLPDGRVLVAGGYEILPDAAFGTTGTAETYNPASGIWTPVAPMLTSRAGHSAILLTNGQVLVAAGVDTNLDDLTSSELYDSMHDTWTATGNMFFPHNLATSTLLPDGHVLVTGGAAMYSDGTATSQVYSPDDGVWTSAGNMTIQRYAQTATLLPDGNVFVTGGTVFFYQSFSTTEIFNENTVSASPPPQITAATSPVALGGSITLAGSQFLNISNGNASTNYPIVQLRSLESDRTILLTPASPTSWSDTNFTSARLPNFPPGYAFVTVFANGTQSVARIIQISPPVPTSVALTHFKQMPDGAFQFTFTNSPGAIFGVQTSTNLNIPLSEWPTVGGVVEISPGHFQFTDTAATDGPHYYRLRAP